MTVENQTGWGVDTEGLVEEDWDKLLRFCETLEYKAKEVIVKKGDFGEDIFLVVEGQIEIYVTTMFFSSKPVATLRQGEIFGEVGFLLKTPRTAYVVARTDISLLRLTRSKFHELERYDRDLAYRFKALLRKIMQQRAVS